MCAQVVGSVLPVLRDLSGPVDESNAANANYYMANQQVCSSRPRRRDTRSKMREKERGWGRERAVHGC